MKSKIIKVSIILIFMMFSAGLFNFCFALTESWFFENGVDFNLKNIYYFNTNKEIPSADLLVDYVLPSSENLEFHSLTIVDDTTNYNIVLNNIENGYYNTYLICNANGNKHYYLEIEVPLSNDVDNILYSPVVSYGDYILKPSCSSTSFRYNFDTKTWKCFSSSFSGKANLAWFYKLSTGEYMSYIVENTYCSPIYFGDKTNIIYSNTNPVVKSSIKMEVNQTGTKTGNVTFTPENWDSHMYYIKDDMDELVRLIAEEELSPIHDKVKLYNGPIAIDYGEYVMGLLFDSNGTMIFSEISNTLELDSDIMFDDTHRLRIDKSDLDTYYLFIHSPQEGDYIKVSSVPNTASDFNNEAVIINGAMTYNGLSIRDSFINGFNQLTREINITKNTVNYFYLYDVNNNLVDSAVLNTSNYYDGSYFDFDVDLSYGNNKFDTNHEGLLSFLNNYFNIVSATEALSRYNHTCWVKVIPTIDVPSIDNYELYLRVSDYGSLEYIDEEDRNIFMSHDNLLTNNIGVGIGLNSNTNWHRIDDKIYDYFYLATLQDNDAKFTFELQLRSASGQVIETKTFKINLSANNKAQGTVSSSTNGKDDTYVRNPDELSGIVSSSNKFDFSGLNNLTEQELKTNVEGLIDSSIGFFGLFSTIFLLLPTWVSSLLYLFFFGMIVITLLRFIRGS